MSLLTIIQDACSELSLQVPTTIIGNADPQVSQLLALSNIEGQRFCTLQGPWGGWPELNQTKTFRLKPFGPFIGTLTNNSATISAMAPADTATLQAGFNGGIGFGVAGPNIPQSATIISIASTAVVLSIPVTGSSVGASINFGQIQYPLPADIRSFVNATQWDRNFRWPMLGPLSPVEWQVIVSGISPVGPRIRFRVQDNLMTIQPLPGTAQTDQIAYEYVSNAWCTTAAGVARTASGGVCRWGADTDLYLWPEDTQRLGVKWRFLAAKGLPYLEEKMEWSNARDFQLSTSGASRSLRMNATANGLHFLNYDNIPDTGFGGGHS